MRITIVPELMTLPFKLLRQTCRATVIKKIPHSGRLGVQHIDDCTVPVPCIGYKRTFGEEGYDPSVRTAYPVRKFLIFRIKVRVFELANIQYGRSCSLAQVFGSSCLALATLDKDNNRVSKEKVIPKFVRHESHSCFFPHPTKSMEHHAGANTKHR